jgi:tRNA-splicing ligase RtcB
VDAEQAMALGLEPGEYLALLSHSGSRGAGAQVCEFYSKRAMALHEQLPKELKQLAWLSLADADGQEYWAAMSLMGLYAAANHALITATSHVSSGWIRSSRSRTIITLPGKIYAR